MPPASAPSTRKLTPEEEAALLAQQQAAPASYASEPVGGNDQITGYADPYSGQSYGQQQGYGVSQATEPYQGTGGVAPAPAPAPAPAQSQPPTTTAIPLDQPVAADPYNYGAAEPYGVSPYAVEATGNALAPQSAYSPPPLATVNADAYAPQPAAAPYQRPLRDNPPGPPPSDPFNNPEDSARIARIRAEVQTQQANEASQPGGLMTPTQLLEAMIGPGTQDSAADAAIGIDPRLVRRQAGNAPPPDPYQRNPLAALGEGASQTLGDFRALIESDPVGDFLSPLASVDPSATDPGLNRALGTMAGLNPDDPYTDMANQLAANLYDWTGDRAADAARGLGDLLAREGRGTEILIGDPLAAAAGGIPDLTGRLWGLAEDVAGPHGMGLRQLQSTANAPGAWLAQNIRDPLGAAKDDLGAAKDVVTSAPTAWWQQGPGTWFDENYRNELARIKAERERSLGSTNAVDAARTNAANLRSFVESQPWQGIIPAAATELDQAGQQIEGAAQRARGAAIRARLEGDDRLRAASRVASSLGRPTADFLPDFLLPSSPSAAPVTAQRSQPGSVSGRGFGEQAPSGDPYTAGIPASVADRLLQTAVSVDPRQPDAATTQAPPVGDPWYQGALDAVRGVTLPAVTPPGGESPSLPAITLPSVNLPSISPNGIVDAARGARDAAAQRLAGEPSDPYYIPGSTLAEQDRDAALRDTFAAAEQPAVLDLPDDQVVITIHDDLSNTVRGIGSQYDYTIPVMTQAQVDALKAAGVIGTDDDADLLVGRRVQFPESWRDILQAQGGEGETTTDDGVATDTTTTGGTAASDPYATDSGGTDESSGSSGYVQATGGDGRRSSRRSARSDGDFAYADDGGSGGGGLFANLPEGFGGPDGFLSRMRDNPMFAHLFDGDAADADAFFDVLARHFGEERATELMAKFGKRFGRLRRTRRSSRTGRMSKAAKRAGEPVHPNAPEGVPTNAGIRAKVNKRLSGKKKDRG